MPPSFFKDFRSNIFKQFFAYSGIGAIGTLVHYLTLMTMVEFFSIAPVPASVMGFTNGAIVNYYLNYHITFQSKKLHREAFIKFITVALVGLLLNTLIMAIATEVFTLHYLLAQVIATALVLFWNFTGNRLWTFRGDKHGA